MTDKFPVRSQGGRRLAQALALPLVLAAACSTVPENHYFTMAYSLLPQHRLGMPARGTLRVRPFDIGPAYNTERIVYRYSPYEFQYYNYMLWATKPHKMITELLIRHLRHCGLFHHVDSEFVDEQPDFELSGDLVAIEELDSGNEWFAHLAMNLRLNRYRSERVLWSKSIDVRKRVYNKEPVYVVKALSELLEAQMQQVVKELAAVLGQRVEEGSGR